MATLQVLLVVALVASAKCYTASLQYFSRTSQCTLNNAGAGVFQFNCLDLPSVLDLTLVSTGLQAVCDPTVVHLSVLNGSLIDEYSVVPDSDGLLDIALAQYDSKICEAFFQRAALMTENNLAMALKLVVSLGDKICGYPKVALRVISKQKGKKEKTTKKLAEEKKESPEEKIELMIEELQAPPMPTASMGPSAAPSITPPEQGKTLKRPNTHLELPVKRVKIHEASTVAESPLAPNLSRVEGSIKNSFLDGRYIIKSNSWRNSHVSTSSFKTGYSKIEIRDENRAPFKLHVSPANGHGTRREFDVELAAPWSVMAFDAHRVHFHTKTSCKHSVAPEFMMAILCCTLPLIDSSTLQKARYESSLSLMTVKWKYPKVSIYEFDAILKLCFPHDYIAHDFVLMQVGTIVPDSKISVSDQMCFELEERRKVLDKYHQSGSAKKYLTWGELTAVWTENLDTKKHGQRK